MRDIAAARIIRVDKNNIVRSVCREEIYQFPCAVTEIFRRRRKGYQAVFAESVGIFFKGRTDNSDRTADAAFCKSLDQFRRAVACDYVFLADIAKL